MARPGADRRSVSPVLLAYHSISHFDTTIYILYIRIYDVFSPVRKSEPIHMKHLKDCCKTHTYYHCSKLLIQCELVHS